MDKNNNLAGIIPSNKGKLGNKRNRFENTGKFGKKRKFDASSAKKVTLEEKPIVDFTGWPKITNLDYSQYPGLLFYVNSIIQPKKGFERAISNLIVNLFVGTKDCFTEPREYNTQERMVVKEQLLRFKDSVRTLDVILETAESDGFGNFGKCLRQKPSHLGQLLELDTYKKPGEYDLVVLHYLQRIIPSEKAAKIIAGYQIKAKYKERINQISTKLNTYDDEKLNFELITLGAEELSNPNEDMSEKEYIAKLHEIYETKNISPELKSFLGDVLSLINLANEVETESIKAIADLPKPEQIVSRFAESVVPNGVLMLNFAEWQPDKGFRQVDKYDQIQVYQRIE